MKSAGLFELVMCALALGLGGCGRTENDNPFQIARPDAGSAGQAGAPTAGAAGSTVADAGGVVGIDSPPAIAEPVTQVASSTGCGSPFLGQSGAKVTVQTSGVKAPDCAARLVDGTSVCGPWKTPRDYYVSVPVGYDPNKAYPLVFEAPGCGGTGTSVYAISELAQQVIRVGLTPGPNALGHGTNPEQGCFDNREGDDSIDWVFYEAVYDRLNAELCFDRNRVFVIGAFNGATFGNELACKYAGDALRPIRAAIGYAGGLPTDPRHVPSCHDKPTAGLWVNEIDSGTNPFSAALVVINRAMALSGCPSGQTYETAQFSRFPIGRADVDNVCQRISGCDPLFPLVVCPMLGAAQSDRSDIVDPGAATFIKLFSSGSLITQ